MSDIKTSARGVLAPPIKKAWRGLRQVLPDSVAEGVRVPVRKVLKSVGLAGKPVAGTNGSTPHAAAAPAPAAATEALVEPAPDPSTFADPAECPICGTVSDGFKPFGMAKIVPERQCPGCGCLERHRATWLFYQRHTNLFTEPVRMLHIAAEPYMAERLLATPTIDYLTADIEDPRAMEVMDITDIKYPDGTFDVVVASHVLEHIPDDVRAMSELRRVLKPGGWAVLQVPIWGPKTRDDPSITDPDERERRYGQPDHVRMYGHDGEYERRLRQAGWEVERVRIVDELGPELSHRYRLLDSEDVYYCTNPG
jgi:hypothetical protein